MTNQLAVRLKKKELAAKGVEVGKRVRVSWSFESQGTHHEKSHEGVVTEIGDWIKVDGSDSPPGHIYLPIASVTTPIEVEVVEKVNPMIERLKARG